MDDTSDDLIRRNPELAVGGKSMERFHGDGGEIDRERAEERTAFALTQVAEGDARADARSSSRWPIVAEYQGVR